MISKGNHIKTSVGRRIFIVCNTLLMVLLCAVFLSPYLNVLAQALNDTDRELETELGQGRSMMDMMDDLDLDEL